MILTSTTETVPYTPAWREGQAGAPVFHLRAGSVIERGQMEAELSGPHRAGKVWGFDLRAAVRDGVSTLLADDPDLERLLDLIDAEGEAGAEQHSEVDARLLADTRNILAEHWPAYRDLVAQLERRRELAPIVALRRFCVDIDGVTFKRGADGLVSEATLAALDPLEMSAAGNRAFALQYPSADTEGNSAPLSPSDSTPAGSKLDGASPAAGKSARRSGKKTPGSSSRRGRGPSLSSGSSAGATPPR